MNPKRIRFAALVAVAVFVLAIAPAGAILAITIDQVSTAGAPAPENCVFPVVPGVTTYWGLATEHYGAGWRADEIQAANGWPARAIPIGETIWVPGCRAELVNRLRPILSSSFLDPEESDATQALEGGLSSATPANPAPRWMLLVLAVLSALVGAGLAAAFLSPRTAAIHTDYQERLRLLAQQAERTRKALAASRGEVQDFKDSESLLVGALASATSIIRNLSRPITVRVRIPGLDNDLTVRPKAGDIVDIGVDEVGTAAVREALEVWESVPCSCGAQHLHPSVVEEALVVQVNYLTDITVRGDGGFEGGLVESHTSTTLT